MLDKFKSIFGMEDSEEKSQKLHSQLTEYATQMFQVSEWNGKLYITVNGVPIKDSFNDNSEIISELEGFRTTWVSFMESHPSKAKQILINA